MSQPVYPAQPPESRIPDFRSGTPRPRSPRGRRLWVWMPVWSMGILSCVPFFRRALLTRRRNDWLVTTGYLAATVVGLVLVGLGGDSSKPNASPNALGYIGTVMVLVLMAGGAVHVSTLYRQPDAAGSGTQRERNAAAVSEATQAARRRAEARRIAEINPVMARDLKIGRPDLPRTYDDGGLIDVNRASPELLARILGWTLAETAGIVAARERAGGFSGLPELMAYAELDPQRFDAVADLLVFCRI